MNRMFSVIVVCLNAGDRLYLTIDSVLRQTFRDYEILIKDGESSDKTLERLKAEEKYQDERIRVFVEKDTGIYDAMNQAVEEAFGQYLIFLNCGDMFYDEKVLEKTAETIRKVKGGRRKVFYGNTYSTKNAAMIVSPPVIDGFACYRNIPCHQSCFYQRELCTEKKYEEKYAIRADYEHFLWCFYRADAAFVAMDFAVSCYEGGGFSERRRNIRRSRREHKEITKTYIPRRKLFQYRVIMALTLAPLRSFLAENKAFSGLYHKCKQMLYGKNGKRKE